MRKGAQEPAFLGAMRRTGFELELLAPRGKARRDLAEALAAKLGAGTRIEYGLKYHSDAIHASRRPVCHLTPAYRIRTSDGRVLATIVDDNTINKDLDADAPDQPELFRFVVDDLRIAIWLERHSWTHAWGLDTIFAQLTKTFDGTVLPRGVHPAQHPEHRVVIDPVGHALGVVALYGGERERVSEIVTAPLWPYEREAVLDLLLETAAGLGFACPHEAALHLHLDRQPWMNTGSLKRLILGFSEARTSILETLSPNPACTKLGPFSARTIEAAGSSASMNFDAFCKLLRATGATKYADINILGLINEPPLHPTLEVRCLPMSMEAARIEALTREVERFLTEIEGEGAGTAAEPGA